MRALGAIGTNTVDIFQFSNNWLLHTVQSFSQQMKWVVVVVACRALLHEEKKIEKKVPFLVGIFLTGTTVKDFQSCYFLV